MVFGMAKSPFRKRTVWCPFLGSHRRTREALWKAFFESPPSTQNVFFGKEKAKIEEKILVESPVETRALTASRLCYLDVHFSART